VLEQVPDRFGDPRSRPLASGGAPPAMGDLAG
jgi:hypothetical protein